MTAVICLKHGNKYTSDYVNKLSRAVARNTTQPYQFICYTEDRRGVDPDIECRPLPTDKYKNLRGWWFKVWFFSAELGIQDQILYFDLDTVIVGCIDEYFTFRGDLAVLRDLYAAQRNPQAPQMGTGVLSWNPERVTRIWETFRHNSDRSMRFGGDQQYLMSVVKPVDVVYWQDFLTQHKLCSYKAHIRNTKGGVPNGVSVVCFHGTPRPHEMAKLPWMQEHWK